MSVYKCFTKYIIIPHTSSTLCDLNVYIEYTEIFNSDNGRQGKVQHCRVDTYQYSTVLSSRVSHGNVWIDRNQHGNGNLLRLHEKWY